jgi:hypothetical protein
VAKAVAQVLNGTLPAPDTLEPNDDAGPEARTLVGAAGTVRATVDFWDDQSDVYRIRLRRGEKLYAVLSGPKGTDTALALWRPATQHVDDLRHQNMRIRHAARNARRTTARLLYRARRAGLYYLQVKIEAEGSGPYKLEFAKTRPQV